MINFAALFVPKLAGLPKRLVDWPPKIDTALQRTWEPPVEKLASEVNADRETGICGRGGNFHNPCDIHAARIAGLRPRQRVAAFLCFAAYFRRCRSVLAVQEVRGEYAHRSPQLH